MKTVFSETLVKLRKEAGFKTAYGFFYRNGGKPIFKISYRMYLLVEQGKLTPPFKYLGVYVHALRLVVQSFSAMQLVSSWLRTTLGEDSFRDMLAPFMKVPQSDPVSSPFHKAIKKSLSQKKNYINPCQMAVIVSNKATWLCWNALLNDVSSWSHVALARQMQLPPGVVKVSLRKLAEAKLIKRMKDGSYRCLMAGEMIEYPQGNIIPVKILKRFQSLGESVTASGDRIFMRRGLLRASSREFHNCFPLLELNLDTASTYGITHKQKDSALFSISCDVVKIRDF